jgi:hypothetical protein
MMYVNCKLGNNKKVKLKHVRPVMLYQITNEEVVFAKKKIRKRKRKTYLSQLYEQLQNMQSSPFIRSLLVSLSKGKNRFPWLEPSYTTPI